ncbi:MAG TPA: hypothetical protein VEV45_05100 [Streptosporangiaceae bacterium]|nr:hypothetical protein [Streptosporangiaceae bacterium]
MAEIEGPIRTDLAVLRRNRRNLRGTLILDPDNLTHVRSRLPYWSTYLGAIAVALLGLVLFHAAPGTAAAVVGARGGLAIGGAVARRQAPAKAAAGGPAVTVVPLDSITNVTTRKGSGWLRIGRMTISTLHGTEYTFRLNPAIWLADLAGALAARGHDVQDSPDGLAVLAPHAS